MENKEPIPQNLNPEEEINARQTADLADAAVLSDDDLDKVAGGVDIEFLK